MGSPYTLFNKHDEKNILLIEKLIKKKIKKLNLTKINLKESKPNIKEPKLNINSDKRNLKQKNKFTFLPVENFLNFKESGQIPEFLNTKKSI